MSPSGSLRQLSGVLMDSGCHPRVDGCGRMLVDDFLDEPRVARLIGLAERAMDGSDDKGGPTIADINSGERVPCLTCGARLRLPTISPLPGYVRDTRTLVNMYKQAGGAEIFSKDDYG
jgi:hypothetical protein